MGELLTAKRMPTICEADRERFLDRLDRSGGPDACWLWRGGVTSCKRYGVFGLTREDLNGRRGRKRRRKVLAHRFAAVVLGGVPETSDDIHHRNGCSRMCCNPRHLSPVSRAGHALLTVEWRDRDEDVSGERPRAERVHFAHQPKREPITPTPRDVARFLTQVQVEECGCWVWLGGCSKHEAIPIFAYGGRSGPAHRFAWQWLRHPEMPRCLYRLTRTCGNPLCVCPEHIAPKVPSVPVGQDALAAF